MEGLEDFTVTLSNPSNAQTAVTTAQGFIVNDDEPVGVSIDDVEVAEGDTGTSDATFTVTLSAASPNQVTVDYATVAGTALETTDYTAASGTLTFAAGETSKTITVPIIGDLTAEDTETFDVVLSQPSDGLLMTDAPGVGTITDTDQGGGPQAVDDQALRDATVTPVTINVLTNDTDFANTRALTVSITEQPESGTAVVNNDNTITYTPATAGATAPQFLTYRVSNGTDSDTAQVGIYTSGVVAGLQDPVDPANTRAVHRRHGRGRQDHDLEEEDATRDQERQDDLGYGQMPGLRSIVLVGGDGDDKLSPGEFKTGSVRLDGGSSA